MTLSRFTRLASLFLIAGAVTIGMSQLDGGVRPAEAANFTVSKLADTNDGTCNADCSLREAITAANGGGAGPHNITFAPAVIGTIALAVTPLPTLVESINIDGPGAALLTVSAAAIPGDRSVFTIDSGIIVTIEGLTITGGSNLYGGGIYNSGTLTVQNATITGNDAIAPSGDGAGIYNNSGSLTLTTVTMTDNEAYNEGGAIFNLGGTVSITNSLLAPEGGTGNVASEGGGIYNNNGLLEITSSSISENSASTAAAIRSRGADSDVTLDQVTVRNNKHTGGSSPGALYLGDGVVEILGSLIDNNTDSGSGGGIYLSLINATIDGTTISNNTVNNAGAGLYIIDSSVTITNSTVSGNGAGALADDRPDYGGGIYHTGFNLDLVNVTISGNTANTEGGGMFGGSGLTMTNVTFAGNTALTGDGGALRAGNGAELRNVLFAPNTPDNCYLNQNDSYVSLGGNMSSDSSCPNLNQTGDDNNVANIMIGALEDNGGPVPTHALLEGSPAIDSGVNTGCPATDARGEPRPVDGNDDSTATCDVGAYEYQVEQFQLQCSEQPQQGGIIPRCLRILKDVPGGSDELFSFEVTITPPNNPVFNDTFDVPAGDDGLGFGMSLTGTTYQVVEDVPDGWDLTDISCQGDGISFIANEQTGTLLVTFLGNQQGNFAWGICIFTNEEEDEPTSTPTRTPTATATATWTSTPTATPTTTPASPAIYSPDRQPNVGGVFQPQPQPTKAPVIAAPAVTAPTAIRPPSTGDAGLR